MKKNYYTLFFCLFLFSMLDMEAQIYVRADATGNNDGTSWEDAYTDLQEALANADADTSIWVAAGVYKPDSINGNRASTFLIETNLTLLGGFPADGGALEQRNPEINETILSGDLSGDDVEDDFENNRGDNVMTVLMIESNVTNETLIDGFIIRAGHANGPGNFYDPTRSGGGIYAEGAPVVEHCIFQQNFAADHGGGAYFNYSGNQLLELNLCSFINNYSRRGAGLNFEGAVCKVMTCTFKGNIATQHGGGMRYTNSVGSQSIEVMECVFENNQSTFGGGLRLETKAESNSFVVVDCQFTGNSVSQLNPPWDQAGGGLDITVWPNISNTSTIIENCQFRQNSSTKLGGAAAILPGGINSAFELRNSQFTENTTEFGSTATIWGSDEGTGAVWVDSCHFENNMAAFGGGLEFAAVNVGGAEYVFNLSNSSFISNEAWEGGGALSLWSDESSKAAFFVERCTMTNNLATNLGGGIAIFPHTPDYQVNIRHSFITDNQSQEGAAIAASPFWDDVPYPDSASVLVENSLIARNSGPSTLSALRLPNLDILNCTVVDNEGIGVALLDLSGLTLQNTILYNPGYNEFEAFSEDVVVTSIGGNLVLDSSLNDFLTPQDKSETLPDFMPGTYEPSSTSPLINAGINEGVSAAFDLAGNDRIQYNIVDIGAYESMFPTAAREVITGELVLFPNPPSDFFHIQFPETKFGSIHLQMFDVEGQLIMEQEQQINQMVNIKELIPGTYFVKGRIRNEVYVGRLVKQ